jgi:hypothetical protein
MMIAQNLLKRIQVRYDELASAFQDMAKLPVNNGKDHAQHFSTTCMKL